MGDTVATVRLSIMLVMLSIPAAKLFLRLRMNEFTSAKEHPQRDKLEKISYLGLGKSETSAELKHSAKKLQKMSAISAELEPEMLL